MSNFYNTYFPCDSTNVGPVLSADTALSVGQIVSGVDPNGLIRCYKIVSTTGSTTEVASYIRTHSTCKQCEIDICRDYPLPTLTSTATPTITQSPSVSGTHTPTPTPTLTGSQTTPTPTETPATPTPTETPVTQTPTQTLTNTPDSTPTLTPSPTSLIACGEQDIVLLIDESGSITNAEWQNLIDGCVNVVNLIKPAMDTGNFQVGVIRWSFCNEINELVSLTSDYDTVYNALTGATKLYNGGTQPSNAIKRAYDILDNSPATGASKNIVLITDGVFNDFFEDKCNIGYSTSELCNSIKTGLYGSGTQMKIIPIGIGTSVNTQELLSLATSEDYFLESIGNTPIESFQNFKNHTSLLLPDVICSETPDNSDIDVWRAVTCCGEQKIIFVGVPTGTTIAAGYDGILYFDVCYYFHSTCIGPIDYLVDVDEILPAICSFSGCTGCPTPTPTPTSTTTPGLTRTATPTLTTTPGLTQSVTSTQTYTPSNTPTKTTTQTYTPTNTPTKTYDICIDVTSVINVIGETPDPTPTPTNTPTVTLQRDFEVTGITTFVIDSGYFECNEVAKLTDCNGGAIYYVNTPLIYNGSEIQTNKIIKCEIDGSLVCATYNEKTDGTSTNFIFNITDVNDNCGECTIDPTPTPTPTPTYTPTYTPTPTPTVETGDFVYVFSGCGTNNIITQTDPVTITGRGGNLRVGDVVPSLGQCWEYLGTFNNPYFPPAGFIVTNYNFAVINNISESSIYLDCDSCETN